jgi:hypothetical protein
MIVNRLIEIFENGMPCVFYTQIFRRVYDKKACINFISNYKKVTELFNNYIIFYSYEKK